MMSKHHYPSSSSIKMLKHHCLLGYTLCIISTIPRSRVVRVLLINKDSAIFLIPIEVIFVSSKLYNSLQRFSVFKYLFSNNASEMNLAPSTPILLVAIIKFMIQILRLVSLLFFFNALAI